MVLCLTAFAGRIALVKYPADIGPTPPIMIWGPVYQSLADTLTKEGHVVDCNNYFGWREPRGYDVYFLVIHENMSISKIDSLQYFVEAGGRLILQECWWYPRTSDCLSEEGWPCFTGNPYWNIIDPIDTLPCFWADSIDPAGGIVWTVSFATEFSPLWEPACGIDTLTSAWFCTYSFDDSGALEAVAFGGADVSTGLYDSFPPVILNGRCGRGEITALGGTNFLCDAQTSPTPFNMLRFHDNCQFARQLFQCNERADSARLVLENDSTAKVYLEHDSLLFLADSSFWEVRFTVDTIRNYSFYGHEFGAEGFGDSLAVTFRPGYFYDTVEVCLVRLPDSTGETILPCGRICDTFPERTSISETPGKPDNIEISVHPNPFNSAVRISVGAIHELPLHIEIFDINGRMVYKMPVGAGSKPAHAGGSRTLPYEITWQPPASLGSGVYLVRARFGSVPAGETVTKRVVYLK